MIELKSGPVRDGVAEHDFEVVADGERVPAVLWAPEAAAGGRPLVLMGHGASQHKKTESLAARARHFARTMGWATLAIDALGHGERISPEDAAAMARDVAARVQGQAQDKPGPSPIFKTMGERARRIVPEWRAALDAAQSLSFIGAGRPVGYWGLSMGTVLGVPFVAAEKRVTCAVFGLGGVRPKDEAFAAAARAITVPVEFTFQWHDAIAARDTGLALFEAFGSAEKSMHINPGGHGEIPRFENASWEAFFRRHLGATAQA
jgi:pimeloyl-ACP methyl ester carboxylesterase